VGSGSRLNPFNQWRRSDAVSPLTLYDQFGREIGRGDGVLLATPEQIIWVVRDVVPNLEREGPQTLCQLTLTALYKSGFPGGTPLVGLMKILDVGDTQPAGPKVGL